MKKIFEEYGGIVVTVVAVCCLIGYCAYIMMPTGVMAHAFESITSMFTDKSAQLIQDVGSIDGNGGSGGAGGAGESGGTGEANAAGLYVTGTNYTELKTPWQDLLDAGVIHVENGVVYSNVDMDSMTNSSASALAGDLKLPDDGSVTKLGDFAIDLDTFAISGQPAFLGCTELTGVQIPDSVTTIGAYAFGYCTGLNSVVIGDGVTNIGEYAFGECTGLNSVALGDRVTIIETYAFWGCVGLTSVELPYSVTNIGFAAFGASGLTSIAIPDSVTSIGARAFQNCAELASITVDAGNITYHSSGNCLVESTSKTLIAGCKTSVIPSDGSVTGIADGAFGGMRLTSLVIPGSVISIGSEVFSNCTELTGITFEGSVSRWNAISFVGDWNSACPEITIACTGEGNGAGAGTVIVPAWGS